MRRLQDLGDYERRQGYHTRLPYFAQWDAKADAPDAEFSGTLLGFDDYVNMVLEDVTEYDYSSKPTKLSKILLNGNNICMV